MAWFIIGIIHCIICYIVLKNLYEGEWKESRGAWKYEYITKKAEIPKGLAILFFLIMFIPYFNTLALIVSVVLFFVRTFTLDTPHFNPNSKFIKWLKSSL